MKRKLIQILVLIVAFCGTSVVSWAQPDEKERIEATKQEQMRIEETKQELMRVKERQREQFEIQKAIAAENSYVIHSGDGGYTFFTNQGKSSSQLRLTKRFEGESASNEGTFEVDETVHNINFTLNGKVRDGEIRVKLLLPDGKAFKDMQIDNSADIQYSQMIRIAENEKKYYGKWTYKIEAVKADGTYSLQISTN